MRGHLPKKNLGLASLCAVCLHLGNRTSRDSGEEAAGAPGAERLDRQRGRKGLNAAGTERCLALRYPFKVAYQAGAYTSKTINNACDYGIDKSTGVMKSAMDRSALLPLLCGCCRQVRV